MSDPQADLGLLRRFEPILRFTEGEQFFPMPVEPYVQACSLWVQRPDEVPQELVPVERLDLNRLAFPYPDEFGAVHYLRLVEPLEATRLMVDRRHEMPPAPRFHAGLGRLARVGYGSRLIDALFSISLLARGRVPGDTAAAGLVAYQRILEREPRRCYYGRVIRDRGWIVLQYWFFYLFNNWRSGFFGANDHESDWEMVNIYLSQADETSEATPEWVAYAAHDASGDDLRRHWLDAEVEKVDEHPVVYVGAGSHANYFQPGEYLTEIRLSFLAPLARFTDLLSRFWQQRLRQYGGNNGAAGGQEPTNIFRVPFVDYARGDGMALGPGQAEQWSAPELIEPPPRWVSQYRGLWGLYTEDPFAGEDAPSGPMYNRDGSVRRAWYDPVGWAGLEKVPPTEVLQRHLVAQTEALRTEQQSHWQMIRAKEEELQGLGVRAEALRVQPHLYRSYRELESQITRLAQEVDVLREQVTRGQAELEALQFYFGQLQLGVSGPLRAHLHYAHHPASAAGLRFSRLAEVWAALSVGLMMFIVVMLVVFARSHLFLGLFAALALFTFIEASFRGAMIRLVTSATVSLSIIATLVILYEFFWPIVILLVLVTGVYILWENLLEVWQG